MTIANIFDILLLILLALVTLQYMRRGFVAGLIQFLGNLLGLVGAALLSPRVADWIFLNFFEGGLTSQIQTTINQQGTVDLAALVDKYAGFLPQAMQQGLVDSASELLVSGAPDLSHSLVTELIQPLVTPLIAVVVFFVCFAVCKLLVSFLAAVFTNLNRVPLVGGVFGVDRKLFPQDCEGVYTASRTTQVVSRGLGGIRLFNRRLKVTKMKP